MIDLGKLTSGLSDPIKLSRWIVPVIAGQILLQVSGGDIGQLTDI
jgi:hypothetical protein